MLEAEGGRRARGSSWYIVLQFPIDVELFQNAKAFEKPHFCTHRALGNKSVQVATFTVTELVGRALSFGVAVLSASERILS